MIAVFLLMFISSLSKVNKTSWDDVSFFASGKKRHCTDGDIAKIDALCSEVEGKTFWTTCIKCRQKSLHYTSLPFEKAIKKCLLEKVGISDDCGNKRVFGTKDCDITCTNACYHSFCEIPKTVQGQNSSMHGE